MTNEKTARGTGREKTKRSKAMDEYRMKREKRSETPKGPRFASYAKDFDDLAKDVGLLIRLPSDV
jgi:hypothetical protein